MAVAERSFAPTWMDLRLNDPASNHVIDWLVTGRITMLELFQCDVELFDNIREEVMALHNKDEGQTVASDHPTAVYVQKSDPTWRLKPGTIHQYSLYNSRDDVRFNGEDSHWHAIDRRFNSRLKWIPGFVQRYFGRSELQNFRMQSISGGGDLGLHREKIIGIPNRPQHFKIRFHLPIVTNPGVQFIMDGQRSRMKAGWVYLFNQACMHGVENRGNELRIHLVFDCYLNDHILQELVAPAFQRDQRPVTRADIA